jgi:hypothetical protein
MWKTNAGLIVRAAKGMRDGVLVAQKHCHVSRATASDLMQSDAVSSATAASPRSRNTAVGRRGPLGICAFERKSVLLLGLVRFSTRQRHRDIISLLTTTCLSPKQKHLTSF